MKGRWFKSILMGCLTIIAVLILLISYEFFKLIRQPMVAGLSKPATISVEKNTGAASFSRLLESKGYIDSARFFIYLIRAQGLAHCLKAGVYEINPGESAQQLLEKVVAGQVLVESFRIIEGTTLAQVSNNLEKANNLQYEPSIWKTIQRRYPSSEGLLLADTYQYNAGSSAQALLQVANQKLEQFLNLSWQSRNPNLPYKSPYELLIAASILEKEASLSNEKKLISGVIVNRLKKNMPLQMDPTVIYAMGTNYQGKLTHNDLSIDSPYNTYRYRGLPPTPIAMVGKEAIDAAAHPQATNFLYFVAKGDGSHQFSETYEEQKKAISRYQKQGEKQ